jgi:hypothetical protein
MNLDDGLIRVALPIVAGAVLAAIRYLNKKIKSDSEAEVVALQVTGADTQKTITAYTWRRVLTYGIVGLVAVLVVSVLSFAAVSFANGSRVGNTPLVPGASTAPGTDPTSTVTSTKVQPTPVDRLPSYVG